MKHYLVLFILAFNISGLVAQNRADADKLVQEGNRLFHESRYAEASELFTLCIVSYPAVTDAFLGRAMTREQLRDYAGAITDYSVFLEKHPQHFEALLGRANVRFKTQQFEQARADYNALLTVPAGETSYVLFQKSPTAGGSMQITTAQSNIHPRIFNYLGLTEFRLGNTAGALHWLDSAIQLEPANADFYVNRGIVREKTHPDLALQDYNTALKITPSHPLALHNIGVLKSKKGGGEEYFEQAIENDSTMLAPYLERGYQRMQSRFYKGAVEDYSSALAIEKNDPEIWLNRGFAREKLNDLKGAYSDYTEAIRLDEQFEKAWLNRGNVLARQNKYKEAIEDYTVAISVNPEYAAAYYNRAIAREKLKQKSEACADVQKAESLGIAADMKLKETVCP